MPVSRRFGAATVIALTDAQGPFFAPRQEAFPQASPAQWQTVDRFDPGAVTADGRWWLQFRSFAIREESGAVTMVDCGIGPIDSPAASWAPVPGVMPQELAAAGIDPDEVDTVVLTHLHTDHVGWAVVSDGQANRPYFRNARYVLQRADAEAVEELNPLLSEQLLDPLRQTGQLSIIDGQEKLSPTLTALATPGHTPGHQSVLLESEREKLAVTGDLLVHAIQLLYPELAYDLEVDKDTARASRLELLRRMAEQGGELATPHLSEPFLSVPSRP